jgi:DNA-binding beta-propeller fold protein YncE
MPHFARMIEPPVGLLAFVVVALVMSSLGCESRAATEPQKDETQKEPEDATVVESDETQKKEETEKEEQQIDAEHPFPRRAKAPEFPKDMTWMNTGGPIRVRDLKGKFVLLDFWTYCCINCIHILPELKKLEKAYPNELVVIGVHSAKFDTEKVSENIAEAILRYEIEHPVVNDADHKIWESFAVNSWPSLRVIDPEGNLVAGHGGEIRFEQLDAFLKHALPYYKKKGTLDESPLRFDLLTNRAKRTPLRFPGKVLADEASNRLFISDSNNNRIVIATLDGELLDTIGSGAIGFDDGGYDTATFDHPQGMALQGEALYVADTENHALRKIDLKNKEVKTISGTGVQAQNAWPGLEDLGPLDLLPKRWVGKPSTTALNSPWTLFIHKKDLYIAMAGPHQIWKMPLDESEIGPYAGNGREDIVDGPLLPERPYELGYSSFAQPSGLTSDGAWLYVADSEGSSIRAVPLDPSKKVKTVVGTSELDFGRLFDFGDVDGPRAKAKLQHCLGVAYLDGKIYVADTYNNKVKTVDAQTGETKTLAGTGKPGRDNDAGTFDEPAGITHANGKLFVADTNNHLIRTVEIKTGKVETLDIKGLQPPKPPVVEKKPTFPGATQLSVAKATIKPVNDRVTLNASLKLPDGWKINKLAPMSYLLEVTGDSKVIDRTQLATSLTKVEPPSAKFKVSIPVSGDGTATVKLSLNYYFCQDGGEGLCKVGSVVWTVPLSLEGDASESSVEVTHVVDAPFELP